MEARSVQAAARRRGAGRTALQSVPVAKRSLPRGPHALPQEVVLEHQRQRLLAAAAEAIWEKGLAELTVRDLIGGAGVSRRTFYQLFDDKLGCVLAAHAMALGRLEKVIRTACKAQRSWPDGVAAAVATGLEFAARSPAEARLILIACHTVAEPQLLDATRAAHEKFVALLREGRERCVGGRAPLELTESGLVGAVTAIVGARLSEGDVEDLRGLGPPLVQMILAPYLGQSEAQRFARAA
jgi:AcrR family transcriptional regulator